MNLKHLIDIGQHDDRGYLETLRKNLLHGYKPNDQYYETAAEMILDRAVVDNMAATTALEHSDVTGAFALHALERVRQLYHCNQHLYETLLGTLLNLSKQAYDAMGPNPKTKWPDECLRQVNDHARNCGTDLQNAVDNDRGFLKQKYKDWGCPATKDLKTHPALQVACDFYENVRSKLSGKLSRDTVARLLDEDDSIVYQLCNWLNGLHTICRKYSGTDMDIDPTYLLFVRNCYPAPKFGANIGLDSGDVYVAFDEDREIYNLLIAPRVWKRTFVDIKNFLGLSKGWNPTKRDALLQTFFAHDMFGLGHTWVHQWGDRLKRTHFGALYKNMSDMGMYSGLKARLQKFTGRNYTQAQFATIIEEITGDRPDLRFNADPDLSKPNEVRAAQQRPFLYASDLNQRASGEVEDPAETPNPKRIVTETGTPVEPKKATEKKKDDSMTMYIAAAALLALIMY